MIARDSDGAAASRTAFSLTEVLIALGVVTSGLVVVLVLMPALLGQQREQEDTLVALRLPDAVRQELLRQAAGDFVRLADRLGEFAERDGSGLRLVAKRDGTDLRPLSAAEPEGRGQYFLIDLHRFPGDSPLAADPSAPWLAVQARVSWPFRSGVGATRHETPADRRRRLSFNLIVQR